MGELGDELSPDEFAEYSVYFEIKNEREEADRAERKRGAGKTKQQSMGK